MLKKKIEKILEGLQYTHIQEGKSKLEIMQENKDFYKKNIFYLAMSKKCCTFAPIM